MNDLLETMKRIVGGGLGDLEEDQLAALLRRLESMDAVPPISPAPAVITDFDIQ